MNIKEIDFLKGIYADQKLGYSYFKDQYALQLLQYKFESYQLQNGAKIREIKEWDLGFLMDKKPLKELASLSGDKIIRHADLVYFKSNERLNFNINFSRWGEFEKHRKNKWDQTTRPGYNLVLRLNFSHDHDVPYYKIIRPIHDHPFRYTGHPVCKNNDHTMAWARLDFDLDTGEMLIEEVQNDWIRDAEKMYKRLCMLKKKCKYRFQDHWFFEDTKADFPSFEKYLNEVLKPYKQLWDEAILSAAIWFSVKELGIKSIYFHTYEGGCYLKNCRPPKSIYTKLPRRFGFKKTEDAPFFIKNCMYLRKILRKKKVNWWHLQL